MKMVNHNEAFTLWVRGQLGGPWEFEVVDNRTGVPVGGGCFPYRTEAVQAGQQMFRELSRGQLQLPLWLRQRLPR